MERNGSVPTDELTALRPSRLIRLKLLACVLRGGCPEVLWFVEVRRMIVSLTTLSWSDI